MVIHCICIRATFYPGLFRIGCVAYETSTDSIARNQLSNTTFAPHGVEGGLRYSTLVSTFRMILFMELLAIASTQHHLFTKFSSL